ncbi:hypothetical protein BBJ28_00017200 [Nothophytophthora sp. Chile5]|nr:hypothetical protein BBJ28_00017200 [Nothophytophthora sp. Chile5]
MVAVGEDALAASCHAGGSSSGSFGRAVSFASRESSADSPARSNDQPAPGSNRDTATSGRKTFCTPAATAADCKTLCTRETPRRLTSDMISFTATVIPASAVAPNSSPMAMSSADERTPPRSDKQRRRHLRGLRRRQREEEEDAKEKLPPRSHPPVRPFGALKIESATTASAAAPPLPSAVGGSGRRPSARPGSAARYGYMYSRGSLESAPWSLDSRERRSSTTSRSRTWSRALSVSHDDDDATTVAAFVTATPSTVWAAFARTVARHADEPAFSGCEELMDRDRRGFPTTAASAAAPVDVAYSWQQHAERTREVARALLQLGFRPGEGVVVSAQTSPLLHALNLAVVALGGVVAHVRSSWSACELRDRIFPAAQTSVVVVDALSANFQEALEALDDQPEQHVRAVVVLGGLAEVDRAVAALDASMNVLGGQDLFVLSRERGVLEDDDASSLTHQFNAMTSRVAASQCCLLSFDYDAHGCVRAAQLSHDNALFTAAALARSFGPLTSRDRLVGYLPLHHVASQVLELYLPLVTGLSVVCAASYGGASLVRVVTQHKPTVFFATPATWARFSQQVYRAKGDVNAAVYRWAKTRATNNSQKLLFAAKKRGGAEGGHGGKRRSLGYMLAKTLVLNNIKKKIGLESCAACYSVLAPLDFELERLFKTVDTPIYQLFGTPESSGFAAINFPHAWEFGSSGRALPGTTIRCDERTQETVLRGRNVFLGYRHVPCSLSEEEDDEIYPTRNDDDGWLRFCQRGFLTPTGFLKISDPRDFLVLATGDWVPIEPFEAALLELMPEVDRVVLIGGGRTFLSALFFLKTSGVASRSAAGNRQQTGALLLDEDALKVGHSIGSSATTVGDAIRCHHWAVHFDAVLETLPACCSVSGFRVRKWILMAADFSVESGELDPDSGDVCRRAVDRKYQSLLDSLYS